MDKDNLVFNGITDDDVAKIYAKLVDLDPTMEWLGALDKIDTDIEWNETQIQFATIKRVIKEITKTLEEVGAFTYE